MHRQASTETVYARLDGLSGAPLNYFSFCPACKYEIFILRIYSMSRFLSSPTNLQFGLFEWRHITPYAPSVNPCAQDTPTLALMKGFDLSLRYSY